MNQEDDYGDETFRSEPPRRDDAGQCRKCGCPAGLRWEGHYSEDLCMCDCHSIDRMKAVVK